MTQVPQKLKQEVYDFTFRFKNLVLIFNFPIPL